MNRGALVAERNILLDRHSSWRLDPPGIQLPHGPAECPRTLAALRHAARVAAEEAALESSIQAARTTDDQDATVKAAERRREQRRVPKAKVAAPVAPIEERKEVVTTVAAIAAAPAPSIPVNRASVLTVGDVSRLVGVTARTVSKWTDQGLLKSYRIPGSEAGDRRILHRNLLRFIRDHGIELVDRRAMGPVHVAVVGFDGHDPLLEAVYAAAEALEDWGVEVVEVGSLYELGKAAAACFFAAAVVGTGLGAADSRQAMRGLQSEPLPPWVGCVVDEDGSGAEGLGGAVLWFRPVDPADVRADLEAALNKLLR